MSLSKKNIILKGVAASPGIAIGKVFLLEDDEYCLIHKEIPKNARAAELKRLDEAIEKTRAELKTTYQKINSVLGENYAKIADVHIMILDDPVMKKDVVKMVDDGVNAEYAVFKVLDKIIRSFDAIEDDYFRERKQDIQDVTKKILGNLLGKEKKPLSKIDKESIVVSHNLTPADTVAIRENFVKAFATDIGGKTSHTAIVAQSLEIPAVVGLRSISANALSGSVIIVDGNQGIVILNPTEETIANYKRELDIQSAKSKELAKLKDMPAETVDKHTVQLLANIDNADEVKSVINNGASGIGLYRSEFMFFNRSAMPSEEEHYQSYMKVSKMMMPYGVIVRSIDLGGDKLTNLGFLSMEREQNPFMGLRAIRLCLKYPEIFIDQLRGILRASSEGKIRLMYPMISGVEELREANKILEKVKKNLRSENIKFDENIEVGAMIEVPSAAIIADVLAKELDFISIGTNDLIQYTLAVDRVNENVTHLYDPSHPAILRLIKRIIDAGHEAGIDVGMCGEMAGDPYYTMLLLGMGLDEFSVSPAQIPKIKKIIRSVSYEESKMAAEQILKCEDKESISKIMKRLKFKERY
ncbi:MAG: phosphoenolpyruvate--protein phosphotransferase [Endomicrobium sp.]|jgi:phosphotransferase system enzyme I (PtsI)|nr:phosphoenolpyruvate--protein phosphotransferase [Endomicrobium sp.]